MGAPEFLLTYRAVGNREDLSDIITMISPTRTPLLSRLKKVAAKATYNEWQMDSLAAATGTGTQEGLDATYAEPALRARTGNYCQIFRKTFKVSKTQEAVSTAGVKSEYSREVMKAMKEVARNIELTIVGTGTGASGATGTARTLKGMLAWIVSSTGYGYTGTGTAAGALVESQYNAMLQTIWARGGEPDLTLCGGFNKRRVSSFSTPSQRNIDVENKRLIAAVDIYDSDFGIQQILAHQWIPVSQVAIIQTDKWGIAQLRPISHEPLADLGGGPRGMVEGELTLVSWNQESSGRLINTTSS